MLARAHIRFKPEAGVPLYSCMSLVTFMQALRKCHKKRVTCQSVAMQPMNTLQAGSRTGKIHVSMTRPAHLRLASSTSRP
eukprot:scaffold70097_cov13-Tisochrysis_lutea.AAC.1